MWRRTSRTERRLSTDERIDRRWPAGSCGEHGDRCKLERNTRGTGVYGVQREGSAKRFWTRAHRCAAVRHWNAADEWLCFAALGAGAVFRRGVYFPFCARGIWICAGGCEAGQLWLYFAACAVCGDWGGGGARGRKSARSGKPETVQRLCEVPRRGWQCGEGAGQDGADADTTRDDVYPAEHRQRFEPRGDRGRDLFKPGVPFPLI